MLTCVCVFLCLITVQEVMTLDVSDKFKIYKCCKQDELLDSSMRICTQPPRVSESVSKYRQVVQSKRHPRVSTRTSHDLGDIRGGGGGGGGGGWWSGLALGDTRSPNCSQRQTLRLTSRDTDRFQLLQNGSLVLLSSTAQGKKTSVTFTATEFCADKVEGPDENYAILVCLCHKTKCVNKCCSSGYIKRCSHFKCTCEKNDAIWSPFHDENQLPLGEDVSYEILDANEPMCPRGKALWIDNPSFKPHHYKQYWWKYPNGYIFSDPEVCGDFVVFDNHPIYQTIGYCYTTFLFEDMFSAGAWLRVIPTVLLSVTLVVLILVPEKRLSVRGWVHSKALLCHTVTLLLSNAVLVAYVVFNDDVVYCRTTPFIMYFSLVAAAFWLNAICINMAWGFGRPHGPYEEEPGVKHQTFLFYSLYAWGSSLVMTTIAATMWYVKDVPENFLRPTLMETRSCFWENEKGAGKMGTLAYFYGPVGALLIVNASLFLFIALRVRHLKRKTSILTRDCSSHSRSQNQKQALLYVRIVWLMGVAEMTVEVTAWALHGEGYYFHLAAEVIDLLRVVSIFVLCVCKGRTLRALRQRLCARADGLPESKSSDRPRAQQMRLSHSTSQEGEEKKRPTSGTSVETVSTICDTVPATTP